MKKLFKLNFYGVCALLISLNFVSCHDGDDDPIDPTSNDKEVVFKSAVTDYVKNTVLPTYKGMADASIEIAKKCKVMQANFSSGALTTADVKAAGEAWNKTRMYWEKSEAFLYGPAANHNIDPHIDSWPLDKMALDNTLLKIKNGESWSIETMGYGLLGFHSVEYMLFELVNNDTKSQPRSVEKFTAEELAYLVAVANDLRNQCVLLEACWAGSDNLSEEKQLILENAELGYDENYGNMMINAGQAGSIYKTYQEAAEEIVQGCIDIADEVGNTKIGRPVNGSSDEDRNYIESPYSLNSIADFVDNIHSISNAYLGSVDGNSSISDYIKTVDIDLDTKVRNLLEESIATIGSIPEPFAKNTNHVSAEKAVTLVGTTLVDALEEVYTKLSE